MLWQSALPQRYTTLSDEDTAHAIAARKAELADRLVILGHHYQQDDVVRWADFDGDSFKLSQLAAEQVRRSGARYVVFCGVHFMAESADILTPDDVAVILPDLSAGCSMADMAGHDQVVAAWRHIHRVLDAEGHVPCRVIPITYMNSTAAIKAFVGEHGGAVCTSSNARAILEWAFAGGTQPRRPDESIKVMFFPDQHLGRNTAADMGYDPATQMALWNPHDPRRPGGLSDEQIRRAQVILWKGHCSVHMLFRPEHVDQVRAQQPGAKVIVHPECAYEVVRKADCSGSTEAIIRTIGQARPGEHWAVGTEVHLVNRLARQAAQRGVTVRMLSQCQCLCTTMYRIDPAHLLWVLDRLAEGEIVNRIQVPPDVKRHALVALNRMLSITGPTPHPQHATTQPCSAG